LQLSIAEANRHREERERQERERLERERLERERIERERIERERIERERAEEDRKERERKELLQLKNQIIEKLMLKADVIKNLKKVQQQSIDIAKTLSVQAQIVENRKRELKDAEIQLERKKILTEVSTQNLSTLAAKLNLAHHKRDQLKEAIEQKRRDCKAWIQTLSTQIESAKDELQKQQQTLQQAKLAVSQAKNAPKTGKRTNEGNSESYYESYIDDFGTTKDSQLKAETAFFFPANHSEFPLGFYPESDFGALITFKSQSPEAYQQAQVQPQTQAQPQSQVQPKAQALSPTKATNDQQEEFDPFKDNLDL